MSDNNSSQALENEKTSGTSQDELIEEGKKHGMLNYEEVVDRLSTFEIEPEEIDEFYEQLEEQGIEIISEDDDVSDDDDIIDPDNLRDLSVPLG